MPPFTGPYLPPQDLKARKSDELADQERVRRTEEIDRYWRYYEGKHQPPLKVRPGQRDDNVIVNLCAQAVDKTVAFFAPKPPKINLPEGYVEEVDEKGVVQKNPTPEQQQLDDFWDRNDLELFLVDLALEGLISGHCFVKLLPNDLDERLYDVALLDTAQVTVFWDQMNRKRRLWYRLQWELDSESKRRQDIVPNWMLGQQATYDPNSEWTIIEYEMAHSTAGRWQEVGRDPWPHPFPPVVDWKNDPNPRSYYGRSSLRHAAINDAVNFTASNTLKIIKHHASPKEVVVGVADSSKIDNSPDRALILPEGADAKLLEMGGDLASSMNMLEWLRSSFFTNMRVVDWASQKDKVGALTNFGLRVLFGDMLDMVRLKHRLYGGGLATISRYGMILQGGGDEVPEPEVEWIDPLPQSHLETVQAAQIEAGLGFVSDRTICTMLGWDYDQEQTYRLDEKHESAEEYANVLGKINDRGMLGG